MSKSELKRAKISNSPTRTWTCNETGEVLEATELLKPIGRSGFMITYLSTILSLVEVLGNKKMKVVKYILANMEKTTNTYLVTTKELAKKTNSSEKTVIETLKILKEAQIIQRRTGAIMISPNLIHKGSERKERALLTRFQEFDSE